MTLVMALFLQGCPLDVQDVRPGRHCQTPLMAACSGNQVKVVKLLFKLKHEGKNGGQIGLNDTDTEGKTALMRAAAVGAMEITELLLAAGCQSLIKDSQGLTAANYARKVGMTTYLRFQAQLQLISR